MEGGAEEQFGPTAFVERGTAGFDLRGEGLGQGEFVIEGHCHCLRFCCARCARRGWCLPGDIKRSLLPEVEGEGRRIVGDAGCFCLVAGATALGELDTRLFAVADVVVGAEGNLFAIGQ